MGTSGQLTGALYGVILYDFMQQLQCLKVFRDLVTQFVKPFILPFSHRNHNVIIPKITVKCNVLSNNTSLKDICFDMTNLQAISVSRPINMHNCYTNLKTFYFIFLLNKASNWACTLIVYNLSNSKDMINAQPTGTEFTTIITSVFIHE